MFISSCSLYNLNVKIYTPDMAKSKFYVVWKGSSPGIYRTWSECEKQIKGVPGARFKSFSTREEAESMYQNGAQSVFQKSVSDDVIQKSLCVDAACSGNPGVVEYRGVYTESKEEAFRKQPIERGTNNLGEFLAIVHGLALLKREKSDIPIYSDSETAMLWVKKGRPFTKLVHDDSTEEIWKLVGRAVKWLDENTYTNPLLKWNTQQWGEIPADFGRK
jgi:ribonuclease HI